MFIKLFVVFLTFGRSFCRKQVNQDLEKYFSSSTEDVSKLFQLEKDLWNHLKVYREQSASAKDEDVINEFLENTLLLSVIEEDPLLHVSCPYNAFQCIKRTTRLWEPVITKLGKQNKLKKAKQILRKFPEKDDFEEGAAFGLLTLQLYYNISYSDMMSGRVLNSEDDKVRLPTLDAEDAEIISKVAGYVQRLDKQVEWLQAGVDYCQGSRECEQMIQKLNKVVENHDKVLMDHGLGHTITTNTPDGLPEVPVFTFKYPISTPPDRYTKKYIQSLKKYEKEAQIVRVGGNIKLLEKPTEMKYLSKTFHRMWYYGNNITRSLCAATNHLQDDLDGDNKKEVMKCSLIHYHNPYIKLGPFKYELLSHDPHVGMFRDFFSHQECDTVIKRSRDKIKSSPYQARGGTRYLNTQRVSKRLHISEDQFMLAKLSSERISLATNWIVHQEKHASDEYNVINYGIGGQIEVHVDYWNTDNKRAGGARISTFLTYLSDVSLGGRTVFPGLGLSVQPDKGSALFWLTVDTEEDYDSRMYHMGCPVGRGNKWVMTKWIYSDSQMWTWPCTADRPGNYASFDNNRMIRNNDISSRK